MVAVQLDWSMKERKEVLDLSTSTMKGDEPGYKTFVWRCPQMVLTKTCRDSSDDRYGEEGVRKLVKIKEIYDANTHVSNSYENLREQVLTQTSKDEAEFPL